MITISLSGKEVVVRPKHLLDYIEKLDYIKSRRQQPYDLLRDWPQEAGQKGAEASKMLIGMALETVYTRSSSVSIEEEICFDGSWEGAYYNLWRCMRTDSKEDPKKGVDRARKLYESATEEERIRLKFAIEATDEDRNIKNSDGPSESQQPPGQAQQPA